MYIFFLKGADFNMGNFHSTSGQKAGDLSIEICLRDLLTVLGSDKHERGEAIEEVHRVASSCRRTLEHQLTLQGADNYRCLFWNLDILIHEASNMLSNPKYDLFLYLKAIHSLRESMKTSLQRLNISAA
ncbi:hypothetical protein [Rufibacter tibetensis]|uniref:Uncharacterized protein n=1 Tax=Rufibacter tibetensis TaxID=512763 RepID=A0A0N7HWU6_9BACT|nr:hypothetical protein [Rufibacter tibetensis]ALJ00233.1 hypothetical protein DC20_16225 [Rufibacter tibetensis]